MRRMLTLAATGLVLVLPACYHATIQTGRPASNEVIEEAFASSWIYGLVPPKPVATMARCPSGVSKVETQLTFVNQLVGFLTLGIYTPMSIKVTCATSGSSALPGDAEIKVGEDATHDQVIEAFRRAADLSAEMGAPAYVRF